MQHVFNRQSFHCQVPTLVASVSLGVFAVTVIGTMGYRRSLAMRRAGYWGESEFDRL